jgi:restriction system protein
MAVPSFFDFIHPLLQYLAEHPEGVKAGDAHEAVADRVGLTEEERAQTLPSGSQFVYKNRIGWANDRLKRARLSASPRRGFWVLTEDGRRTAVETRNGISPDFLQSLAYPPRTSRLRQPEEEDDGPGPVAAPAQPDSDKSPDELIADALEELTDSVANELLDLIAQASPRFFESLVLDVLHQMGYGTSRTDLQQVGGSGDGGIDGIISLDRLGLEKVYVQAKRWQGSVSRPEIQGFFGALAGRRATKGVFITSSTFTREAREFARTVSDSIVLVDGDRLTQLMIEYGVGVTHKPIKVPQVDSDYFEEA